MGVAGLTKLMVIGYYPNEAFLLFTSLFVGSFFVWFGKKVHAEGKMASGKDGVITSFFDAIEVLGRAFSTVFSRDRRGNIKERFERHKFASLTSMTFETVIEMADSAAEKSSPMGGRVSRASVETAGDTSVASYELRTGMLKALTGVFSVAYMQKADGQGGLVQVRMESAQQSRSMLFGIIPMGPVTSVAVVPFENFSDLLRERLGAAARA